MRNVALFAMIGAALAFAPAMITEADAQQTMRFAQPLSPDSTWGQGAEAFKRFISEGTNGEIELEVFHGAALGSNREALEMTTMGTLEFVLVGAAHSSRYVPQINAVTLPYLWRDRDTMFDALDGALEQYYNELYEEHDLMLVGWWDNGFRHVSNSRSPINSVDDFRGLRLRTLPSQPQIEFFSSLGAAPTPMDWVEVVPALRQGMIDGQENPASIITAARLYEVQDYYSLTSHMNEPGMVFMSKSVYDSLSPEHQLAVRVAARRATLEQRRITAEMEKRAISELEDLMEVNEVPADTMNELRAIAQDVYPRVMGDLGEGAETLVRQLILLNE